MTKAGMKSGVKENDVLMEAEERCKHRSRVPARWDQEPEGPVKASRVSRRRKAVTLILAQ